MPKPGMITGSVFNSCLTAKVGKVVMKQCCRIACERLGVRYLEEQFDLSGLRAIEWGNENESLAIAAYEADRFVEVHSKQVFLRVPGMMVGGTPDGLVGDDGMIEVKCPNSDNHLLNIIQSAQVDDYSPQIQSYIWIAEEALGTRREWCDFISFDPRFPEGLQMHVRRILRNEPVIAQIKSRAAEMEKIITEMVTVAEGMCISTNGVSKGEISEMLFKQ